MKSKRLTILGLGLVLLGLCAVILLTFYTSMGLIHIDGPNIRFGSFHQVSAETTEERRFPVDGAVILKIDDTEGSIVVTGGDTAEIIVSARKVAWGSDEADARKELETWQVNYSQSGSTLTIRDNQASHGSGITFGQMNQVDFTITVPYRTALDLTNSDGAIIVSAITGTMALQSDYGDITVSAAYGSLAVRTSSGAISASDVQAGQGKVDLRSDYGSVTVRRLTAGDVRVYTSSGDARLASIQASGDITIENNYGSVDYHDGRGASLTVKANSGPLALSNLTISGPLLARNDYGDVTLERVGASSYDLSTGGGAIRVVGASGNLKAYSDYGDVSVTGGERVTLDLKSSSGKVEFSGSLGEGPHTLRSDYGNILLKLPAESNLSVDLKTDYGKIKSALPLTLNGDLEDEHWTGRINDGGASLVATTGSGDVQIEILNP